MKVGIVVPYSWSFWGGVNEHADQQARALTALGHEAKIIAGNDPPGRFTRFLHPREGNHALPPDYVIPVGRSVIAPANGSLPNIVLSPSCMPRIYRAFQREQFDVVHVHEPFAPVISVFALGYADCPVVVTCHSSGGRWRPFGKEAWGFLTQRIDQRIAVSDQARRAAEPYVGSPFVIVPNGVGIPPAADPGNRLRRVVFIGRHDPRKGLEILLRAWPSIEQRTDLRLRLIGADPLQVRWLLRRTGLHSDRIDILGTLSEEDLTAELAKASVLTAPSIGGESFGMVLTRAFACATPVVASDIEGYREVASAETGILVPPRQPGALADAIVELVGNEAQRRRLGAQARTEATEHYSWTKIVNRLVDIYGQVIAQSTEKAVPA